MGFTIAEQPPERKILGLSEDIPEGGFDCAGRLGADSAHGPITVPKTHFLQRADGIERALADQAPPKPPKGRDRHLGGVATAIGFSPPGDSSIRVDSHPGAIAHAVARMTG